MIIAENKFISQYFFPKTKEVNGSSYLLDFYSEIDNKHYIFSNVVDEGNFSDFYAFNLDFDIYEDMPTNTEYNYTISTVGAKEIEHGLLRLGGYNSMRTNQYKINEQYKQYERD